MDTRHKKLVKDLIHSLGLKYQLSDDIIREMVESPYLFSAEIMRTLDCSEITTEEQLEQIKTNFYYKGLGKLHIPFNRIETRIKQKSRIQELNKRRWKN
jgi:hypothetical protein